MSALLSVLIGLFCGILSGYGIGGGSILMVFLTAVLNLKQTHAQSINLVYFLPTAVIAAIFHAKNNQIEWRAVLPTATAGCLSAVCGAWLAGTTDPTKLQKYFGAFLLLIGIHTLFAKRR